MLETIYYKPELNGHDVVSVQADESSREKRNELFPEAVYQHLPPYLADTCNVFKDAIEKDVFLLGALTVISGCLPKVYGVYDNRRVGANIYAFIIAPASAGKGSLIWAKNLVQQIHQYKREQSEIGQQKMLLIPANNSSSGFIEALANSDERGILFCTEADTLSGTLSQDWGNYSELLRSAFHHEPYEMMRRSTKEFYELKRSYLSILLSGTPGQLYKLIPDAENGLFSRFAFYTFDIEPVMRNVFAASTADYEEHSKEKGEQLFQFYQRLEALETPIQFEFTLQQQSRFVEVFDQWHREFSILLGNNSIASIRRLGLIHFRLSMILGLLRHMESTNLPARITCEDQDFANAFHLIEVLKSNAAYLYINFKSNDKTHPFTGKKLQLFEALPNSEFSRKDALALAEQIGLNRTTLDRFLQQDVFEKPAYGKYRKRMRK